jgi:hypothetical protein
MAESLYDQTGRMESVKGGISRKKVYALVAVIIILVGAVGFMLYTSYGGILPFAERITNEDQAASTLSQLGNDLSGITDDLKDMENIL